MTPLINQALSLKAIEHLWLPRLVLNIVFSGVPETSDGILRSVHARLGDYQHLIISAAYQHFSAKNFSGFKELAFQGIEQLHYDEDFNKILRSIPKCCSNSSVREWCTVWRNAMNTCLESIGYFQDVCQTFLYIKDQNHSPEAKTEKLSEFCQACLKDKSNGFGRGSLRYWLEQNGHEDVYHSMRILLRTSIWPVTKASAWEHIFNNAIVAIVGSKAQDELNMNLSSCDPMGRRGIICGLENLRIRIEVLSDKRNQFETPLLQLIEIATTINLPLQITPGIELDSALLKPGEDKCDIFGDDLTLAHHMWKVVKEKAVAEKEEREKSYIPRNTQMRRRPIPCCSYNEDTKVDKDGLCKNCGHIGCAMCLEMRSTA